MPAVVAVLLTMPGGKVLAVTAVLLFPCVLLCVLAFQESKPNDRGNDWQGMSHGSIHLHGHIHSRGMQYNELNRMQGLYRYDVGVDANGFRPVSLDEVLAWFEGVPCSGRVDWRNWVNETGSKAVSRKLAGCK